MKSLLLGIALLGLHGSMTTSNLMAQEIPYALGEDVRLRVPPDGELRGQLLEWSAETLRVRDPASGFVHVLPAGEVEAIRVSRPRTGGQGALRGLLIGSLAGALTLGTAALLAEANDPFFGNGLAFALGAGTGGIVGGAIGTAIGATSPGDRWVDVALEP